MQLKQGIKKPFIALAASIVWMSLGLQFYLFVIWALGHYSSVWDGVGHFLSYFTNLSNLMAGAMLLLASFKPDALNQTGYARLTAGIAVFIGMAGIVFNLELRQLMPPGQLIQLASIILHDINPWLFFIFWWLYVPHGALRAKDTLAWGVFPIAYFIVMLLRGVLTGHYPYPFVNAERFGYAAVLFNGVQMLIGFWLLGLVFVVLDKWKGFLRLEAINKNVESFK